jgi:hypothetical protein
MDRILGNFILSFGLGCATIANLLFAVPIPPSTSYFAFGFPAMAFAAFGSETVYPCLGLYTTQSLAFLEGMRAVEWFCVACMGVALLVTIFGLRHMGKIGLLKKLGIVQSVAPEEKDEEAR